MNPLKMKGAIFITIQMEKIEVTATIITEDEQNVCSYNQNIYIECATLEISEKNLAATNYNQLLIERSKIFNQLLKPGIIKNEQELLNLQVTEYNTKLDNLKNSCNVTIDDLYPNIKFDPDSYLYRVKKEKFNEEGFSEIANDVVQSWAQEQIGNGAKAPMELNITITLANGKTLKNKKTILKI